MERTLTLDLLRHGETADGAIYRGRTDSLLTGQGRLQMEQTLNVYAQQNQWQAVCSSPLQRCLHVARDFADQQGISLMEDTRLQELDFGVWEGQTLEQVWRDYPQQSELFWQHPDKYPPPGGESIQVLQQRLGQFLEELYQSEYQQLLLVTHGGVIRALIADVLGISPDRWSALQLDNGSLSRIAFGIDPAGKRVWSSLQFSNLRG